MKNGTVLVVDDMGVNRLIIKSLLNDICYVVQASSGSEALNIILKAEKPPDLILLDMVMNGMSGLEFMELMKETHYSDIPIIVITSMPDKKFESKAIELGAIDFVSRPFNPDTFKMRVKNNLELIRLRADDHKGVSGVHTQSAAGGILETLAGVIENAKTGGSVLDEGKRIAALSSKAEILINSMLNNSKYRQALINDDYESIIKAIPIHDIGKIGVPESILQKPGRLSAEEYEIIKTHTSLGADIVKRVISENGETMYLKNCYDICLYHHERWDGKGYPEGLAAEHIPLSARISSLLDAYDALTRNKPYKKACTPNDAAGIIAAGGATQFDPYLVGCFMDVRDKLAEA